MKTEKVLFEIPIYSMTEKEFTRRWEKIIQGKYDVKGNGEEISPQIKKIIDENIFPKNTWKYNQIIGYIVISIINKDICFEIYCCPSDKKYLANQVTKQFMKKLYVNGFHFPISNFSDDEIKEQIKNYLDDIIETMIDTRFFVDLSTFNNILPFVNILEACK